MERNPQSLIRPNTRLSKAHLRIPQVALQDKCPWAADYPHAGLSVRTSAPAPACVDRVVRDLAVFLMGSFVLLRVCLSVCVCVSVCVRVGGREGTYITQRLQYPLIKEYTLNQIRDPITIQGIFLN